MKRGLSSLFWWGRAIVNRAQNETEETAIRQSLKKGKPFGSEAFVSQAAARLKLQHTKAAWATKKN